jgi:tetratricopeptide (TPR) repeat protein
VTVLFTDLVDSTILMSRLGAAAFDDVRREHFAALRRAIDWSGGREIKNTGDGVMATFGSVVDAIHCAIAMQQATDRQARATPLAIRVGLSAGEVTFEDGDCFGTPVVEAARLVAAAGPGQILASVVVRTLAGGRATAAFSELGALPLKGLPEAVSACGIAWEPRPEPLVPLPALDVGRIFVGREDDLGRLRQRWKESAAGELRVAFLGGEPGVGKTRLAAELAGQVYAEGATVLVGRCDEDVNVPYQPFVEALRHVVDHTKALFLGRYGGELVRLVPEVAEFDLPPPMHSDPDTQRYRLFDAVASWLNSLSAHSPVLLVLDDLQWATKPTLLMLRHLLRSRVESLLVLGVYRDTEVGQALAGLLADLRRQEGTEQHSLTGLDPSAVARFLAEAAGHEMDDEGLALARAIHDETEGNPFFVVEILRHLAEVGAIERRDGRWGSAGELVIPEGVRQVVGQRLTRLSEDANRALRVAAVMGTDFEPGVVQRVADLDEETVLCVLEESIGARLVIEAPPTYRFAHELVRSTLYEGLTAARRVALHRGVAEALLALRDVDDQLPALAHHWARASDPRAVDFAARAGDRAVTLLAHDEAVAYYRQALELLPEAPPDEGRRLQLLISLGEALRRAGDPAHKQTLLEAGRMAQERGDAEALAAAALANSRRGLWSAAVEVDTERVAMLEQAVAAMAGSGTSAEVRLLATLGLELVYGDRERRVRLSDQALALARRLGDADTLAEALLARYYTTLAPWTLSQQLEDSLELLGVVRKVTDPVTVALAASVRYRVLMQAAEVEEADRCLSYFTKSAAELGQPTLRWISTYLQAGRTLLAGHLDEGERLVMEASELGTATGQPEASLYLASQLIGVRFEQGRMDEMEGPLVALCAMYPQLHASSLSLALAYCELERYDEAKERFDTATAAGFEDIPLNNLWLPTLCWCAVISCRLGDRARSEILEQTLEPYADQLAGVAIVYWGSVSWYLGLLAATLGRLEDAEARFAQAEATYRRIGAPAWLARTRLEWARIAGDAGHAQRMLEQALATSRRLGLAKVGRDALALLA